MQLGGSICVCIGQNVLNQRLIKYLAEADIPGLNPYDVLRTGATELGQLVHTDADMIKLQYVYNESITKVFYVAAAVAGAAIFGAMLVEWKNIKGLGKKFE